MKINLGENMLYFFLLIIGIVFSALRINSMTIQNLYAIVVVIVLSFYIATVSPLHSYDTIAYQLYYSLPPITHRFEIGYMEMSYFFFTHGFNYQTFRLITTLIFQILLLLGVRKFTNNLILFYTLYMIFPFFIDSGQIRFSYMFSLIIFALSFLKEKNKQSIIIACLLIILSSLFQVSGLIYLLVPILSLIPLKKLLRFSDMFLIVCVGFAIIMRIIPMNNIIGSFLNVVLQISGRSGTDHYVNLYSQGSSISVIIFYIISIIFTYLLFRKYLLGISGFVSVNTQQVLLSTFIIGIIFIPTLIASGDFERFLRCSVVVFSIVASIYLDANLQQSITVSVKNLVLILSLYVFITISWRYWTENGGLVQFIPYIIHIYS